eukprot:1456456-Rhodomonas_salina.1
MFIAQAQYSHAHAHRRTSDAPVSDADAAERRSLAHGRAQRQNRLPSLVSPSPRFLPTLSRS